MGIYSSQTISCKEDTSKDRRECFDCKNIIEREDNCLVKKTLARISYPLTRVWVVMHPFVKNKTILFQDYLCEDCYGTN